MANLGRAISASLAALACSVGAGCDLGVYEPPPEDDPPASARLCSEGCHGADENIAPPKDTSGNTETTARGVGAHQAHIASSTWHRTVACAECHTVPGQISDPGHIDDTPFAEVIFGALGGDAAEWNGDTCTNAYCHGATLTGGAKTTPSWTTVDGTASQCGACHGFPPPAPHPANPDCGQCHQTVNPGAPGVIVSVDEHIDGKLQIIDGTPCDTCHGSNGNSAPPRDVSGNTSTAERGVGAHRNHLDASTWHKQVDCSACHVVPLGTSDIGHLDTPLPAEVIFGGISGDAQWDGTTCAGSYCHGAGLEGGTTTSPTWTLVDGSQSQCDSCHGAPPPPPHPTSTNCGTCHSSMIPGQGMTIAYPELHIDGKVDVNTDQPCDSCHGSGGNAAPPTSVNGDTDTTARGVGAHRNHLDASTWHKQIACSECHKVPTSTIEVGHIDSDLPAELTFGPLAGAAVWNGTTCTNSYCHGSTLTGGVAPNPIWTSVTGSQSKCDSCHGAPPPPPHPANTDCGQCHGSMIAGQGMTIAYPDLHIDGKVDVNSDLACNACHGSAGDLSGAPPQDTLGNTSRSARGVGAHAIHLAASSWRKQFQCSECHVVPTSVASVGHTDTPLPAELTFSALAGSPVWNGATCTNTYCHGASLSGGTALEPIWNQTTRKLDQCDSCHGAPPPPPHPAGSDCSQCHQTMAPGSSTVIAYPELHIDGQVQVSVPQTCDSCHGGSGNPAPPVDVSGNSNTAGRGVGAHASHMDSSGWHKQIACSECHTVPTSVTQAGHIDTPLPAEIVPGTLAGSGMAWNGVRCTNSYCHGSTLTGGSTNDPQWTLVDGSQSTCTSCHGFPPPGPHPQNSDCGLCHAVMTPGAGQVITYPDLHIDGNLDVVTDLACDSCHGQGGDGSGAPPTDTLGNTATTVRGVGAHMAHLAADSPHPATGTNWRKPVECAACHVVPSSVNSVGHTDTPLPAELTFSLLGSGTSWNGTTCSGSYCHGSSLTGGADTQPTWTQVDGSQIQCTSCHGFPPPGPHPQNSDCGLCHDTMVPGAGQEIAFYSRHIDGNLDVTSDQACDSCHGSGGEAAPPQDVSGNTSTTARGVGAHRSHLGPSTWHKETQCVQCHKVPTSTSSVGHLDTPLPAELTWSGLAQNTQWDGVSCSNSYCHGSALTGGTLTTPSWTDVGGGASQCGSCHGTPPPPPHPANSNCGSCHESMVGATGLTITKPDLHIDGTVQVTDSGACNSCHGSTTSNAPPADTQGNTATTFRGVGNHPGHLGPSTWHKEIQCTECHQVPGSVNALGHIDTPLPAELTFGALAGGTNAAYNYSTTTCTNNYCHGDGRGDNGTAQWTVSMQMQCNSCHASSTGSLPDRHRTHSGSSCGECHAGVASDNATIVGPNLHIDGQVRVQFTSSMTWTASTKRCTGSCHGENHNNFSW